jgi:dUTP pyrophosphatase
MIMPGVFAVSRRILNNLLLTPNQRQPCGVDLTLKRVATLDFICDYQLQEHALPDSEYPRISLRRRQNEPIVGLSCGFYLLQFNEEVDMSLKRGCRCNDTGCGSSGPKAEGDAQLAQMVFYQISEPVQGYRRVYSGRRECVIARVRLC